MLHAQEFQAGAPISAIDESGDRVFTTDNVKVYGSFYFSESCTFDSDRNLILAMNSGKFRICVTLKIYIFKNKTCFGAWETLNFFDSYRSCSFCSPLYCFVNPHLLATFTINKTLPL